MPKIKQLKVMPLDNALFTRRERQACWTIPEKYTDTTFLKVI